eukprot:TRINITY_DN1810_c0_g2_i1.p2 TRINITY_DN1810_c0_g2~~TRINITY_DN1810_c0_g2_i1.p2  ORF type:complete len:434 (+),score=153.26 TRINITY_DN1810_c0_g2_i1:87-1388(+)
MSSNNFTERALDYNKKACKLDNDGEFKPALAEYLKAIEAFHLGIKYERDAKRKEILRGKMDEIVRRAEEIKTYLDKLEESGGGAGGSAQAHRSKNAKKEDEDAKRRENLEAAIVGEKPNVKWSDIAGLEGAKEALREAVILPIEYPQLFVGNRKPWRGILMYGPPGTGKSYLAKAVATESKCTFFSISSSDIMSKWVGESEKLVRNLFEMARENKPAIIFVDEIDSMCGARSAGDNESSGRVKTEFLVQMQGVGHDDSGILVLAATNLPWQLDTAIRRRFQRRIEIPLPEMEARLEMFKIHLGDTATSLTQADFEKLATMTEMYSGSDISVLVNSALMEPIRTLTLAQHFKEVPGPDPQDPEKTVPNRLVPCSPGDPAAKEMALMEVPHREMVMCPDVTMTDFLRAFQTARPSVSQDDLKDHKKFTSEFGQEG